ncbi:hypothetical protein N474_09290 [Pseudoalteromonas luteoviolacea CPMOR-2]|uniref:Uncharacterized protein n=1 Tax=Pseudoalteromonas luteoviolacea DSM 6061 TaxID=1365250 RepID=A0A167B1T0_9GAMM|nr:hypothetical protein [Pseudoalteromonas luteoviolacea]KZN46062.1 hypothetical protein N475_07660 [Pseudoalteromonas luteoviolacea DSM 6061]KZN56803.1 hypothetical protein N474_09290 [Pseudoalteromonas luteoviolacea CPMOR-2]
MNKVAVMTIVPLCFWLYTAWPFILSAFSLWLSEDKSAPAISTILWGSAVIVQIYAMVLIFSRKTKGLHIFFSVMALHAFLWLSDVLVSYFEGEELLLSSSVVFDKILFPLLVAWGMYMSDIKYFFNNVESK